MTTEEEEKGVLYPPSFPPLPHHPPPPPNAKYMRGAVYTENPTAVSTGRAAWIFRGGSDLSTGIALSPRSTAKERGGRAADKENDKDE